MDVELRGAQPGAAEPADIVAVQVIAASVVWGLLGWALLALLERFTARARTIWMWIALVAFVLSFITPLTTASMTTGTRIALSIMHVAVAAVVIPVFLRTSKDSERAPVQARGRAATA
jgi:hypothetical protein